MDWGLGFAWYVVFVFSVVLHEAAHAWSAMRFGDHTASAQVTLDPLPHIRREPFGMIVLPVLSFILFGWMVGWASTPYDPYWAARKPRHAAMMALAGPAANLLLAVLAGVLLHIGLRQGRFIVPSDLDPTLAFRGFEEGPWNAAAIVLSILFVLNLVLLVFNLLPLPPMDGTAIVELTLPWSLVQRYHEALANPGFRLIGLFVAWNVFHLIFPRVFLFALRLVLFGIA